MSTYIPEDLTEFLYWVKETTENFWSKNPQTSEDDFVCEDWAYGAKWIGLTEDEINEIEAEYDLKFTFEHRQFLKILHTLDRKRIFEYESEDGETIKKEYSFFYNWKTDKEEIKKRFNWPYETILEDVLGMNKVWLKSWGKKRPKSDEEKELIFSNWYKKIPKLIPITGHRFVVSDDLTNENPILSIYGSDTIVYGWNMRHYLLNELHENLNLLELVYDQEDDEWYSESKKEIKEINIYEYEQSKNKSIPVIDELILYWNSGWSSFGKEYQSENEDTLQPIMRTFIAEDEENPNFNSQKKFNDF